MAKKPTITTVATGYQATDTINSNTVALRDAFDNTLSLDGSTPNAMEADLDLNGNDILNVNNIYVDNIIYDGALPIANGGTGASTASGARTNLGLGTLATQNGTFSGTSSGTNTGDQNIFRTIAVSGESNVVADSTTDTLTLVAGSGISITTNASTDSITITNTNSSATLTDISNLTPADNTFIVGNGTTWVAESGSTVRTSLGLGTMATETATNYLTTSSAASTYQPLDSDLTTLGGLAKTDGNFIVGDGTTWVAESGATARTSLGLGTMATETASNYLTTSSAASTYLTQTNAASTYQPLDSDLTAISGLSNADNNFIVGNGTTWVAESGATARTSLGLGTMATETASNYLTTATAASTYQPLDSDLTAIAGLTSAADRLPYFTGSGTATLATFTSAGRALVDDVDAAAQRTTLGLGTLATQNSNNVSITGGSVTGITDLAVADGGTGASTTYGARDNLKFPKMVTPEDFGATGSDTISGATVDQASYIQSALDHLASNGGGILYLNKWYRIATALTYGTSTTNPGSIAVVGVDPNRSGIVTTTGIDGLKFTIASNGDWNVFIQNIGLIRNSSNTTGTAITIKSVAVIGDTATGGDKGHTITNCIIDTASTGYWNKGISLYQCPHSQIYNNWIKGRGAITTTKSGVGIELDVYNMGCKLYYNVIRGFQKAFSVDDTSFFAYTSEGNAVTVRANSTAYTVGQEITVSSNYYCKFRCTTAGTTASSLPAGYASANQDSTITDGTAVFLALTFQAEGFSINNNKIQACDYGTYVNIRNTEVAWKFQGNDYDVNKIHLYLRNLNGTVISGNSFGKSNTLSASQNIMIVADDGNPSGPTLTTDNLNHVIVGNRAFGSTLEMSLDISSITKGSTTTVNYTLTSGYTQYPNNGDYIFITNVSSMTEINEKLFRVGSATTSSFVLLDPEDSSNINSTSYTTFSGSGKVKYANVFATIISGSGINIHSNHCQAKTLGVYIGQNTSDISIEGITVPNGVIFQNRSNSDTVYIDTTAYTIDQTNQGTLTLAGKITTTGSPGIKLGRTDSITSTPFVDFYTYGDPNYRNGRIIASGGSAALDTGTLTYKAATHSFEGTTNITGTTSIIGETDVTNAAGNRSFTVSGSGNSSIYINGGTGQTRSLFLQTGTSLRWTIRANSTAESGSNVGSDLQILRYDDTGTVIDTPFFIKRSTGRVGVGTTSPSCLLDVSGGISTGSFAVTSPAATDGNIFSGTYTPTLTGVTNVASSTAYTTSYMRVGNVVTVAGRIAIDPTATGQTSIGMSLPIASTLGASQALGGTFAFGTDSGQVGAISGDVTNNRASFDILTNSAANRSYYFSFTYRVI